MIVGQASLNLRLGMIEVNCAGIWQGKVRPPEYATNPSCHDAWRVEPNTLQRAPA